MIPSDLKIMMSSIHSFEDFEAFKSNINNAKSIANEIIKSHQLPEATLTLFPDGTNIVFAYGNSQVIKIFPPFHREQFNSEVLLLKHLEDKLSVKTPKIEYEGEIASWPYIVMNKLDGTLLETLWETMPHDNKLIIIQELGSLIREVHSLPTGGLEAIDSHWEQFIDYQIHQCLEHHRAKQLPKPLLDQIPSYLAPIQSSLKKINKLVIVTGEYTPMNFLVKSISGTWHIDALIDFGDAMLGHHHFKSAQMF